MSFIDIVTPQLMFLTFILLNKVVNTTSEKKTPNTYHET